MSETSHSLSNSEWKVMECLWSSGPQTLMQLVKQLGEHPGWAKSTVSTLVKRMEGKGVLTYEEQGRTKVYLPAISREDAAHAETQSLLSKVYHGSASLLVNALVEQQTLSPQELDELYAILEQAKGGAK